MANLHKHQELGGEIDNLFLFSYSYKNAIVNACLLLPSAQI